MEIKEKLINIQCELKVPKNQFNFFGKYNFRNCEDILEAAKPICKKYNTVLILSDEVVQIGERYYVKATAALSDIETDKTIMTTAFAREEETKKGMDGSQITGASSSYARKYALGGLLNIDDTKDSDTTNLADKETAKPPKAEPSIEEAEKESTLTIEEAKNLVTPKGTKLSELTAENLKLLADQAKGKYKEAAILLLSLKG